MNPWRRFRLWILLSDLRREHKELVRSFAADHSSRAVLAQVCTCMPGWQEHWPNMDHEPACRTWLA